MSRPVKKLETPPVAGNERYRRRAMSEAELFALIDAARSGEVWRGVSGAERVAIYATAAYCGLRAGELRDATRADFDLDAGTVNLAAAKTKNRQGAELPLVPELVEVLRPHLADKMPDAPAFNWPGGDRQAEMLRADLAVARRAWIEKAEDAAERAERIKSGYLSDKTEDGRVIDFHQLRKCLATLLVKAKVHPAVAQRLMRHSTMDLTMRVYAEVGDADRRAAVAALPRLKLASA